jgi:hypothetical protein
VLLQKRRHIKKDLKVRHYNFYLAALSINTFVVRVENATAISRCCSRISSSTAGSSNRNSTHTQARRRRKWNQFNIKMMHSIFAFALLYISYAHRIASVESALRSGRNDGLFLRQHESSDHSYHHHRLQSTNTVGQIQNLILIDADTDLPLLNLTNGTIINILSQPTSRFNVQATTFHGGVGSVRFGYNGNSRFRTETGQPFSFCGDRQPVGNYMPCQLLVAGQHTITATPFSNRSGTGIAGTPYQVTFQITNTCNVPEVRRCVLLYELSFRMTKIRTRIDILTAFLLIYFSCVVY